MYAQKPETAPWDAKDAVFGVWIGINEYIPPFSLPPSFFINLFVYYLCGCGGWVYMLMEMYGIIV